MSQKSKFRVSAIPVELFPGLSSAEKNENKIRVAIAERIASERKRLGYSQSVLVKKAGINQAMVSHFESGDYNFTIDSLCRIMSALGLSPSISFTETESSMH